MRALMRMALALALLATGLPAAFAAALELRVETALAAFDSTGAPVVNIRLEPESARAFGAFTAANIGRRAELRVDGELLTAPVIRDPILGGEIMISGSMTVEDAGNLAMKLRGGGVIEVEAVDAE